MAPRPDQYGQVRRGGGGPSARLVPGGRGPWLRNPQSVFDAVARGSLPEPILKMERGYAFWDLYAILNAPAGRKRTATTNTEVTPA